MNLTELKTKKEELYDLYITRNYGLEELQKKYNCSQATIARALRFHGIKKPKEVWAERVKLNAWRDYSINTEAIQNYFNNHTVEDTANKFEIPIHRFYKILAEFNINKEEHIKFINSNSRLAGKTSEELQAALNKGFITKRENKSFSTSKLEENYYKYLLTIYNKTDIIRQYKDERYPFNCDFYIKSEDLFIECNYHWSHGSTAFNPNDAECIKRLKVWEEKAKTSKYYQSAIDVWTRRDPLKIKCAKENQLNYKVLYN